MPGSPTRRARASKLRRGAGAPRYAPARDRSGIGPRGELLAERWRQDAGGDRGGARGCRRGRRRDPVGRARRRRRSRARHRPLEASSAFVFGSPMYRATFAAPFKALMDAVPRGMHGEQSAPLTGRAAVTVATAASDHHFLGPAGMRDVLVDFFACHVVSPGLYVPAYGYDEHGALTEPFAGRADAARPCAGRARTGDRRLRRAPCGHAERVAREPLRTTGACRAACPGRTRSAWRRRAAGPGRGAR